jgi:hypothetical protein
VAGAGVRSVEGENRRSLVKPSKERSVREPFVHDLCQRGFNAPWIDLHPQAAAQPLSAGVVLTPNLNLALTLLPNLNLALTLSLLFPS